MIARLAIGFEQLFDGVEVVAMVAAMVVMAVAVKMVTSH
jgi:hypothetical protein